MGFHPMGSARPRSECFEGLDIGPDHVSRRERYMVVLQPQGRSVRLQQSPGDVQRVVEIVPGRFWIQIGPERLEQPLAMQPVTWREGQQLDERCCFPTLPGCRRDGLDTHRDPKPAQKMDADLR